MKLTKENVISEYPNIKGNLSKDLQEIGDKLIPNYVKAYDKSDKIKEVVDKFLDKANEYLSKNGKKESVSQKEDLSIFKFANLYMPDNQREIVNSNFSEFKSEMKKLDEQLKLIPKLYETEKLSDSEKMVYAHYFFGSSDIFVIESNGKDELFVFSVLNGDYNNSELGYESLEEIKKSVFELDFYWKPVSIEQAKYNLNPDYFKKPKTIEKEEPVEKPAEKPKKEKRYKIVAWAKNGETGDDQFYEEEIEQIEGGYKSVSAAKKVAENFIKKQKKMFDCKADIVEYVDGEKDKVVLSLSEKAKKVSNSNKPKKQKKEPEKFKGEYVAAIPEEVKLINRYCWMHGKKMSVIKAHKSNNPNTLLNAIQKAITEKRITKNSKYAEEIMNIQKSLVKMCNGIIDGLYGTKDVFESANYDKLIAIVRSYKIDDVTAISKSYISAQEKEKQDKKVQAQNLLKRIDKLSENEMSKDEVKAMKKALKDYIDGKTNKIETTERQLRGLYGLLNSKKMKGLGSINEDGVMRSTDFVNANFDTIGLTGRWESFFGKPSKDFRFMFYGAAGSGKSTFALSFAKYLSKDLGKKVLYVASEERFGYTLKEKIDRLGVANNNFYLAEKMPINLTEYDVVFFDSVNDLGIEPDELNEISKGIASVAIFQCTKDGAYRGGQAFAHDCDTVIRVDNMIAYSEKNRFGQSGKSFAVR